MPIETLIHSFLLVFVSEIGDKTQLLALVLATRYRKPWTILLGILIATVINHALAAWAGAWVSTFIQPHLLSWILAVTFFVFGLWILVPDKVDEIKEVGHFGVLITTIIAFFLAEMGDKTQLATIALGANSNHVLLVTIGTTLGMLGSNSLAIFFGPQLLNKIPMIWVRRVACLIFFLFGILILIRM